MNLPIIYLGKELEVLLHCEGVPEYVVLRTQTQTFPHAVNVPVNVVAVDQSCSACWRDESCAQCINQCQ